LVVKLPLRLWLPVLGLLWRIRRWHTVRLAPTWVVQNLEVGWWLIDIDVILCLDLDKHSINILVLPFTMVLNITWCHLTLTKVLQSDTCFSGSLPTSWMDQSTSGSQICRSCGGKWSNPRRLQFVCYVSGVRRMLQSWNWCSRY
jgi:hypothetical protein